MMSLLHLVSYVAAVAAFLFVTLSLASGLLFIGEVIEEHSKLAKTVGRRAIYAVIGMHLAFLVVDRFPIWPIVFSIVCHLVYLQNFSKTWPVISLTAPTFLASCVLVLADHFVWFWHFSTKAAEARAHRRPVGGSPYTRPSHAQTMKGDAAPAFMDVASFFGICVWFIPLYLFLSLSANDNALPSIGSASSPSPNVQSAQLRQSIFLALYTRLSSLLPSLTSGRRSRNASGPASGLLAPLPPRTPGGGVSPIAPQSYSPWGAPEGLRPSSPAGGMYTPGGSPYGSPLAGNSFQQQMLRRPSGMGLTPPPPPKRANSQPSSPVTLGEGLPGLGAPPQMKRKTSNLGLGTPNRSASPLSFGAAGGNESAAVLSGRISGDGVGSEGAVGGMAASIGRRRGDKMGGKED